ncbi:MAG: HAD family hydrolase [Planctomycetota bacterium]
MPTPRAILLDLDGTLIDATDALAAGILELAAEEGLTPPGAAGGPGAAAAAQAWARGRVGFSPYETWALLGARDPEALVGRFRARYLPGLPARTRVMDGALAALTALSDAGHLLAVATTRTTDSARDTLAHAQLLPFIRFVGGGDLVERHKPAPDVLLLALRALNCAPHEALMVGDTAADVLAARAAGCPCWAVLGGTHDEQTLRESGADRILFGGIADLPAALARHGRE